MGLHLSVSFQFVSLLFCNLRGKNGTKPLSGTDLHVQSGILFTFFLVNREMGQKNS